MFIPCSEMNWGDALLWGISTECVLVAPLTCFADKSLYALPHVDAI